MGTFEYQEANYFITRVNFLFYDMTPYSDFEYAYGLLYLYTPLLFKNVGLSTEISYLISYILFFILGNYMLYSIMSYLNIKKYFLFITLIYLNFSFGLNYNIIRFVISYYFIIIMYQQYLIYENSFKIVPYAFFSLVISLLISPEIFFVYAISLSIFSVLIINNMYLKLIIFTIPFAMFFIIYINFQDIFRTFFTFSSIRNSINIQPFSFGGILLMMLGFNTYKIIHGKLLFNKNIIAIVYIMSIGFLPIIFVSGWNDLGHTVFPSLGIILLFLYFTKSEINKYILISIVTIIFYHDLNYNKYAIASKIYQQIIKYHDVDLYFLSPNIKDKLMQISSYDKVENEVVVYLSSLSNYKKVAIPFGAYNGKVESYLLSEDKYHSTYFSSLLNIKNNKNNIKYKNKLINQAEILVIRERELINFKKYKLNSIFDLKNKIGHYYIFKNKYIL